MIDLTRRLSPHFTLGELLRSETAERIPDLREAQRNPPPAVVTNLEQLVDLTLEPIREGIQLSLFVTSGYRSPGVNRRVVALGTLSTSSAKPPIFTSFSKARGA